MTEQYLLEFSFSNEDAILLGAFPMRESTHTPISKSILVYEGESSNAKIKVCFDRRLKTTDISIRQLRPDERGQSSPSKSESVVGANLSGDDSIDKGGLQNLLELGQLLRLFGLLSDRDGNNEERRFDFDE